jgi:hypothetical protein
MDHRYPAHRLTRLGEVCIIFAQASVAIEPAQGPFDNPALRDDPKALEAVGTLRNLQADRPLGPQRPDPVHQGTGIGAVGPAMPQPRALVPEDRAYGLGAITVLHAGSRDDHREAQPARIDEAVALAAVDRLVGIKAAAPPVSVVLTDWLSMMPALGWRRLPAAARISPRSRSCIRCQVPSRRHWQT